MSPRILQGGVFAAVSPSGQLQVQVKVVGRAQPPLGTPSTGAAPVTVTLSGVSGLAAPSRPATQSRACSKWSTFTPSGVSLSPAGAPAVTIISTSNSSASANRAPVFTAWIPPWL
ncbi:hypothetical protein OL239_01755 [Arthrobacter sp. ATA002]|uniref:hypothetical protein n=1 Tax=Arthrobacter sp. ATA002 TaxID=2991715 RepID=UPI0022A669A0|nr:hypothetical protein [Arthrobacter sp. ATA002]WAP52074.1 hypothetical protein OL239_01755 [Arthrobacter sp. ATA002]